MSASRYFLLFLANVLMVLGCCLSALTAHAGSTDINGPAGSGAFGTAHRMLPNGNVVVIDAGYDAPGPVENVGAVHLYSPHGALISTLTGSKSGDQVGSKGILILSNGNFVVGSPNWANGAATKAGAVTWCSGTTGLNGAVSAINSLVGTTTNDQVGESVMVKLTNGNYVVGSRYWNNGAAARAGAATWGSGTTGIAGAVTATNSLVGDKTNDYVGQAVTALTNGNYVVDNSLWKNVTLSGAGSATWGNGTTGVTGVVSASNSLVGGKAGDLVGYTIALSNGNYLVMASQCDNGTIVDAGAITWGDGSTGVKGVVSTANSLMGSTANDLLGRHAISPGGADFILPGIYELSNGNYIVQSTKCNNGAIVDAGAVTWGSGTTGVRGAISSANSLMGNRAGQELGLFGAVVPLTNGNYVVTCSNWFNGSSVPNAGAVAWCDGSTGRVGTMTTANSLVGTKTGDKVGVQAIALTNGHYVVRSPDWSTSTTTGVGAVTWCNGTTGRVGSVSASNSVVGTTAGDGVGYAVSRLNNGNYVVRSPYWDNGGVADVGAATWASGTATTSDTVSTTNSLVGSTANDRVGYGTAVLSTGGGYVVTSMYWSTAGAAAAGAATWCSGAGSTSAVVSESNSLVGSQAGDNVGSRNTVLTNGNYVVVSQNWQNGTSTNAGALTWGSGSTGVTGVVSALNSLVGQQTGDNVGGAGVYAMPNGNYLLSSSSWDNGTLANAGAVTLGDGAAGATKGYINSANSVPGLVAGATLSMVIYDTDGSRIAVGRPSSNSMSLFSLDDPDIAVEQPVSMALTDGGSTIAFGTAAAGATSTRTFTIRNEGLFGLSAIAGMVDGANSGGFSVGAPGAVIVPPGGSTTIAVTFSPTGGGARNGVLHLTSNDPDETSFEVALTASGPTYSEYWRYENFGSPDNSGNGADDATPQQDGVTNLMKFATGMDPDAAGTDPGVVSTSGGVITFVYDRADVAVADGVNFIVEWSDTLAEESWSVEGVTQMPVDQGATDEVTATVPAGAGGRRFVRLRVER